MFWGLTDRYFEMGAHYFSSYFKKKRDRIDHKMFETKNTLFYNTKGWVHVIKSKPLPIIKGQKHLFTCQPNL